jgi:hypothetical protein
MEVLDNDAIRTCGGTGIFIIGFGVRYIGSNNSSTCTDFPFIIGESTSAGYTYIGSNPFVISGFVTSGVVFPNFNLKSEIIGSGICGEISDIRCDSSLTIFNISFGAIRSDRDSASSIRIKR